MGSPTLLSPERSMISYSRSETSKNSKSRGARAPATGRDSTRGTREFSARRASRTPYSARRERHRARRSAFVGSDSTLMGVSRAEYVEAVGRTRAREGIDARASRAARGASARRGRGTPGAGGARDEKKGRVYASARRARAVRSRRQRGGCARNRTSRRRRRRATTRGDESGGPEARARRERANERRARARRG